MPTPADRDPGQPWRPGTPVPAPVDPDTPTADIHIGYARCSSLTQELQSQLDALAAKNIPRDKIFSEKISTRVRVRKVRSAQTERGIGGTMQKGTLEYEQALDAVIEILRARARQGASPLQYGQLSTELARLGHHVSPSEGPMPYLLEDASVRESPDGSLPLLSALVVLKDTGWPSSGFFKLARRAPYRRSGDDVELWTREIEKLAKHYAEHEH
ncbi:hypothetical protein ABZS71_11610 [Streptomyces sp. NPDC005393]|uniref:hypothetical protein n=1 Tax=Streptomyces sp. NPDC005393 TaxID=3157041 RepID=UPI0033B21E77